MITTHWETRARWEQECSEAIAKAALAGWRFKPLGKPTELYHWELWSPKGQRIDGWFSTAYDAAVYALGCMEHRVHGDNI